MPREPNAAKRAERDAEIWRLVCDGHPRPDVAVRFGVSLSRVDQICQRHQGAYVFDKIAKRAELAEQLDRLRAAASELVDAEPAPMFRGAEPIVDRDDDGEVVKRYYDHGGRLEAMKTVVAIQAREAKMLGLDAPDQIQTDSTVKYVVEGVDMEDLR